MNSLNDVSLEFVPDGGWGWIVVAAVAWINLTTQSISSVFGLLFAGQLKNINAPDTFTLTLIGNLNSLALNFSGLFIGPAIKSFRPRIVAISGCLLVSAGLFMCGFATQPWHFIFGYSICVGLGLGLIAPSTFMAINACFSTKRGRAVGVSLAGTGLGQVLLPHLARYCLEHYGFHAPLIAMSAVSLTGVFGALLLKPAAILHQQGPNNNCQHIKPLLLDGQKSDKQTISIMPKQQQEHQPKQQETGGNLCSRVVQAMDLALLCDISFLNIIIGMALVYTATINFTILYPEFLRNSAGLSPSVTASCMSVVASADIVCRLLLPFLTDKLQLPYRIIFLSGTVGLLLARTALAESTQLTSILIMSVIIGMCKSATVVNNNLVVAAHCRAEKLAGGLGFNMIVKGVLVITLGQLLGWVRDLTHSYVWALHAQNMLLVLVVWMWTPELCYRQLRRKERTQTQEAV